MNDKSRKEQVEEMEKKIKNIGKKISKNILLTTIGIGFGLVGLGAIAWIGEKDYPEE